MHMPMYIGMQVCVCVSQGLVLDIFLYFLHHIIFYDRSLTETGAC